ncbi:MAG: hypothetical protein A4E47_01476 [Methanosaeta sp. PtaU1.Bin028]|nr:MAG: hypothetical protein A4E47_01476 [Methanosaeta sp. PtaU1.Bin028]
MLYTLLLPMRQIRKLWAGRAACEPSAPETPTPFRHRELEAAKEILGEVFGASRPEVDEMIAQRLDGVEAAEAL